MKKLFILCFTLLVILAGCASIPTTVQVFSTERGSRPDGPDGFIIRNSEELNNVLTIFPGMDNTFNNRFFRNYGLVVLEIRGMGSFYTLELINVEFQSNGTIFVNLDIISLSMEYEGQLITNEVIVIRIRQSSLRSMNQVEYDLWSHFDPVS